MDGPCETGNRSFMNSVNVAPYKKLYAIWVISIWGTWFIGPYYYGPIEGPIVIPDDGDGEEHEDLKGEGKGKGKGKELNQGDDGSSSRPPEGNEGEEGKQAREGAEGSSSRSQEGNKDEPAKKAPRK